MNTNTAVEPAMYKQPDFAQDVYAGYKLGLSSFVMNEDIIINKQAFLKIVNEDAAAMVKDDKGLYVFQAALNNMEASSFSLKDLLTEMDFYRNQHPENIGKKSVSKRSTGKKSECWIAGWWPLGSSNGCCGNYEGCCWFWFPICYLHDKICEKTKCEPRWFCLSGCKIDEPESRSKSKSSQSDAFSFIEDEV